VDRIVRFVLRHRWWVIAFWLIALLAGGLTANKLQPRLSANFSLPGQEGSETQAKLAEAYGVSPEVSSIPVLSVPPGDTIANHRTDVADVAAQLRAVPGVQVLDYTSTSDPKFVTDDGRSTFMLIYVHQANGFDDSLSGVIDSTAHAAAAQHGLEVNITGYNQLAAGNSSNDSGPNVVSRWPVSTRMTQPAIEA
jgi:putative drug exporter of the RND superfamily